MTLLNRPVSYTPSLSALIRSISFFDLSIDSFSRFRTPFPSQVRTTALMEASCHGRADVVDKLLAHGADVNATNTVGNMI